MQIEIVKHGIIRTFLKRVVNHTACRLTRSEKWAEEIFGDFKMSSLNSCSGISLVAPY